MTENNNQNSDNYEDNESSEQTSKLNFNKKEDGSQASYPQAPSYPPQHSPYEASKTPSNESDSSDYNQGYTTQQGHNTAPQHYPAGNHYGSPVQQNQSQEQSHSYTNTAQYGHQNEQQSPEQKKSDEYSYWSLGLLGGSFLFLFFGIFTGISFLLAPFTSGLGIFFAGKARKLHTTPMATAAFWLNIVMLTISLLISLVIAFLFFLLVVFAVGSGSA